MPLAHVVSALEAIKNIANEPSRAYSNPAPVQGFQFPHLGLLEPKGLRRRRLVNKALSGSAVANACEVHAGPVSEAARRCKLSELMQAELKVRFARDIQAFKSAKNTLAVAELWVRNLKAGDVAGAFWAALPLPRCDAALREAMCKDLHMF